MASRKSNFWQTPLLVLGSFAVGLLFGSNALTIVRPLVNGALTAWRPPPDAALAQVEDRQSFPNVLLIGDSISIGYTQTVRRLLQDQYDVMRIPTNGGTSAQVLQSLDQWLGGTHWDVIHFNAGLHDLILDQDGRHRLTVQQYGANIRAVVTRLKRTGATLIFATTTAVPKGADSRIEADEVEYNRAAVLIMTEMGVCIDNLSDPRMNRAMQGPKNVHFTPEGYAVLGFIVAKAIETCDRVNNSQSS